MVALPAWLLLSGGVALWLGLRANREREREEQSRFAREVSGVSVVDDVRKLVEVVGRRDTTDETGWRGLDRAALMIEGTLGPGNAGYVVTKVPGPETKGRSWPMLEVQAGGRGKPAVWVVAAYDTRGGGVEANATGVAAVMATAKALAGAKLGRETRMVFVPHGFEVHGPGREGAAALVARIRSEGGAAQVLCVESMGAGEELWVSGRDATAPVWGAMAGLGKGVAAEEAGRAGDFDLASCLGESGLPAARVATRPAVAPQEMDRAIPGERVLAAAAGRLADLVRRLAAGG